MKQILYYIILLMIALDFSCTKFLDQKPNQQLVKPTSVKDAQALLDYYYFVNQRDPSANERSADNYYLSYKDWKSYSDEQQRRVYVWEKDKLFHTTGNTEWSQSYDNVYRANIVIESLSEINKTSKNIKEWNNAMGHALFIRAKNFLQIADIWSLGYNEETASTDLGIPLRLDPDFNKPSTRSSLKETYSQIIKDLKESIPLLPIHPLHILRPSRPASQALLARTYLAMGNYELALKYADSSLILHPTILDYNKLDTGNTWAFSPRFSNPEILISMFTTSPGTLIYTLAKIDSNLYKSYQMNDLRKKLFFNKNTDGSVGFKGSYTGKINIFSGIATDEVYLIKAECLARKGRTNEALNTLNKLMKARWKAGTFMPFKAKTKQQALKIILNERRKELLMRGLRWMDIKRLNIAGANITLKRVLNDKVYILPPNDLRYALPIPEDVIQQTKMQKNPR